MTKITRNFNQGKMNKTFDERVVPDGQYIDALNVRMGSTELSNIGAIENSKGNLPLTNLIYTDGTPLSDAARCKFSSLAINLIIFALPSIFFNSANAQLHAKDT